MSEPAVALFGGSFNPPHLGHLGVCNHVLRIHPGELWLMPAYRHPFGKPLAPFEARLAMCALLLGDIVDLGNPTDRVHVVTAERDVPGHSGRTIDTLHHLLSIHPDRTFRLVLGSDLYQERAHWKDFDELQRLAPPLWIARRGFDDANRALGLVPFLDDLRSVDIRVRLRDDADLRGLVTASVARYISQHGLYHEREAHGG